MNQIIINIFKRKQITDRLAKVMTSLFSLCAIIAVFLIIYFIVTSAIPALRYQGFWNFLTGTKWIINNETGEYQFGALAFIAGTILVLTLSAPLVILTVLFVTEFLSRRIINIIIFVVELLAGIPPVLFAVFGWETIGMLFVRVGASGLTNLLTAGGYLSFFSFTNHFCFISKCFFKCCEIISFCSSSNGCISYIYCF
ncbi:hypothetical protein [Spiroplasma endosymbiont of Poecilobothrus nobilitatus]|uniref:hypothetical protein n=1 Tax=Spiroplasma endosymbiont of Poecilobothrus nobilitatus TaxID=1209220 RepID=UPI00313B7FAD